MIKKELVVANGNYTTRDGQEKTRWVNIGALHEHEGKHYITLDAHINLAGLERREGDTRIFVNMFDPKPRGEQRQKSEPQKEAEFQDSDIPFMWAVAAPIAATLVGLGAWSIPGVV